MILLAYNLILVDVAFREPTRIHRMNVITGDYLNPIILREISYDAQAVHLIEVLLRDKPDKIIFDKNGGGHILFDLFKYTLLQREYMELIEVDAFGLITYY